MAIFTTFPDGEPADYNTAYNDNVWVFKTSVNTPTVRLKIVMLPENYPVEQAIGVVRIYPTTANNGNNYQTAFFDPSRFLQSYIEGYNNIEGANHNGFFTNNNTHKEYYLFVEEEDKNSQGVYRALKGSIFTKIKSVWNGVRNEIDWLDFDYTDYIVNTFSVTKKFLTDSPRTIRIDSAQSYQLSFIVNERFGAFQYNIKAYSGYNGTGSLVADGVVSNNIPSQGWSSRYFRIPVTSEKVTFNINQTCSKYTPVRVHWLNRLGGYDAFNFYMKSIHQTDIKKDKYDQQHHDWTGFAYKYSKSSRGTTDYNVALSKKLTVNTDYLSESESEWMEDLITSPSLYIEENNELIAVNLDSRRIQRKTSLNDKLMQYTFELSYSLKNRRQRG
jgi:hypothetical protein